MIELGMYQNESGYIMTLREVYIEMLDTIEDYFNSLGIRWSAISTEAKLIADGIIGQVDLFGEYSYNDKKWRKLT